MNQMTNPVIQTQPEVKKQIIDNKCLQHPKSKKEFVCYKCKEIYCYSCFKLCGEHKFMVFQITPKLLDYFEFDEYLGRGSYGVTFKVKNLSDDHWLAMKIIDSLSKERFTVWKKEAIMMLGLNHKNIAKYMTSKRMEPEKLFVYLTELGDTTLEKQMSSLNQDIAFVYFKQICEALYYLHVDLLKVHKNLKPSNVLIVDNEIKVCDIGFSRKLLTPEQDQGWSTFAYLSPEAQTGKKSCFKGDIWALGIIFYEMLTCGGHPFIAKENINNNCKDELFQRTNEYLLEISREIKNPLYIKILKGFFKKFFF